MTKGRTIRVAMAVTNDVVTDQRVMRHADALREAGCEVLVVGRERTGTPGGGTAGRTDGQTTAPGGPAAGKGVLLRLRHRRGWRFYTEYNWRLMKLLLRERPDVMWANDTDTLPACWLAARRCRARLVLDCHELFPEVPEIQHKPFVKWVWRTLERLLMPACDARLTVCQSIADHYERHYGVTMAVVRNLCASTSVPRRQPTGGDDQAMKTLLYQGAVNLGRGVDWAIDALQWLDDCRLVVAGEGDLLEAMRAYAAAKPWAARIEFVGRLTPNTLRQLTAQADVGLVMLADMGLSYHYALPNRIADFVAAGVPMVVSDLPEMAAVVRCFGVGEVITDKGPRPQALAEAVRRVLNRTWADGDFAEARADMDWNKEKIKLIEIAIPDGRPIRLAHGRPPGAAIAPPPLRPAVTPPGMTPKHIENQ